MKKFVGASPEIVVGSFLQFWRHTQLSSNMKTGCSVSAVAVSTEACDLIDHARDVFHNSRTKLGELLAATGVWSGTASTISSSTVASVESAVVLVRAGRSIAPFDVVAENVMDQARQLVSD